MHPLLLLFFILCSWRVAADITLDPFKTLDELNNLSSRPTTRLPCPPGTNCPTPLREFNDRAARAFIYRLMEGDYPVRKCLKKRTMLPTWELNDLFVNTLGASKVLPHRFTSTCSIDVENSAQKQSLLLTQLQYYTERLNRGAIQSLLALHEIDSILDAQPSVMNDLTCDGAVSPRAEKVCKQLKQCPRQSQRDALVELIYSSLAQRRELMKQLAPIERKISYFRLRSKRKGGGTAKEELKHLKDVGSTLKGSIAEIESMIPWIKGRIFEKNLSDIEENIDKKVKPGAIKKRLKLF